jgi:hypothetical protein
MNIPEHIDPRNTGMGSTRFVLLGLDGYIWEGEWGAVSERAVVVKTTWHPTFCYDYKILFVWQKHLK